MKVRILYFAALRERMGRASDEVDVPATVATIDDLRAHLVAMGEPWRTAFAETRRVRTSLNQMMAEGSTRLADGAEIAFFPPVTGG